MPTYRVNVYVDIDIFHTWGNHAVIKAFEYHFPMMVRSLEWSTNMFTKKQTATGLIIPGTYDKILEKLKLPEDKFDLDVRVVDQSICFYQAGTNVQMSFRDISDIKDDSKKFTFMKIHLSKESHIPCIEGTMRFCRELEAPNWHYYEKEDGEMLHIRKEYIVFVEGGSYQDIVNAKK